MGFRVFGPVLVAQDLVTDGLGTLSRAWARDAEGIPRPIFLRQFAPELWLPKVTAALEANQRALDLPPACGTGHQFWPDPVPHWRVQHRMSRSIRRIQEQCRAEAFPLDLALSLHVAWTLAHVCAKFWRAGLSVGALSLDSVRVDFEGSLFLPDLAWLPILIRLADEEPGLRSALPSLPRGPVEGDLHDEASHFGKFLYELITFETLPEGQSPSAALERAQVWTPGGPQPLPEPIRLGLARLLGDGVPFETLEEALKEFERIVFEDEDCPSTFNLAYLMRTLFRQDYDLQQEQLEKEREELSSPGHGWVEAPERSPEPKVARPKRLRAGLAAALLAAVCAATVGPLVLRHLERSRKGLETALATLKSPPAQGDRQSKEAPAPSRAPGKDDLERLQATVAHEAPSALQVKKPEAPPSPVPAPPATLNARPMEHGPAARPQPRTEAPAPPRLGPGVGAGLDGPGTPLPATGAQDRAAQIKSLAPLAWPQAEPRVPVVLRVFVHEDGHALRATAVAGPPPGSKAAQAAMEAVLKSRYLPALRGGKAVRDWVEVQFKP